ncbi:acylamino-acid-releasing enzyme-like [Anoplophora glabripennis]|uniref:acylamino-acid-releasing enzyme-like n=2 Tax=Anoplophora glabripennis TaxID=217634 RepID=UPI000C7684D7|nr:acylamino-acid-releasing enzyme-like [Anoplophora glabripennis]
MALVKADLPLTKYTVPQVIVDIVEKEIKIHNGDTFYGLYNTGFPERPWASGNRLLLNTNQKYTINSYVIDIESGHVTNLKFIDGSQTVADVYGDTVLAVQSNYFMPDKLVIGKLPRAGSESLISWTDLTATTDLSGPENCFYVYLDLSASSVSDTVRSFNAIYVGPNERTEKYVPLIVWPHDGPHCAFANFWMMEVILFARFGFGILFINYRGSIGSGQSSVEFLLGKIGRSDVADCITAIDKALETLPCLDPYNLALFGGSYGGFLVTHLSGQYPERFNSVVAHNPIIDMASMNLMSHIPDWCYVEVGVEYTQRGKIDNDILIAMRKASPIVHAHKVKAPTLLQIGTKDLRVPSHQGTEYYLRLKANGVHTRMNLYDGDHSLGIASNEDDIVISLLWIMKHEADNFVNGVHRLNLA